MKFIPLVLSFLLFSASAFELTPESLYVTPDRDCVLRFNSNENISYEYFITDYFGKPLMHGKLCAVPGGVEIYTKLPAGFYEIWIPASKQKFGILSIPEFSGDPDPFFSVATSLGGHPKKEIQNAFSLLKRGGISFVKEIYDHAAAEPEPGKFVKKYKSFFSLAGKNSIGVMAAWEHFPEWTGAVYNRKSESYYPFPVDLVKLDRPFSNLLALGENSMEALQFDNHPDMRGLPGVSYLPGLATLSWLFSKQNVGMPLVSGAFTSPDTLKNYVDCGLTDYIDVFALSANEKPEKMISLLSRYRAALNDTDKPAIPFWVTDSQIPGDDFMRASSFAVNSAACKASGVERYFPAVLNPVVGEPESGMTDAWLTPRRTMAAYLFSVLTLSNKEYAGALDRLPPGVVFSAVFKGADGAVCVLYTGKQEPVILNLSDLPCEAVYAVDGSLISPDSEGNLAVMGGVAYMKYRSPGFFRTLAKCFGISYPSVCRGTPARHLRTISERWDPVPRKADPVVYQLDPHCLKQADSSAFLSKPYYFEVNIFNLSTKLRKHYPEFKMEDGASLIRSSFYKMIMLRPGRSLTVNCKVRAPQMKRQTYLFRDRNEEANVLSIPFDVEAERDDAE